MCIVVMGRPRFTGTVREQVFGKTSGRCFHCNAALSGGAQGSDWDVDHYPVVYRDIEDQCKCWPLGTVTSATDLRNLQPSCTKCNRSHRYEPRKCYYCGHTQLRVRKTWLWLGIAFTVVFCAGLIVGHLTS